METLIDLLFLLNVAILVMGHELDAIQHHEWRFIFASSRISDQAAYQIFVAMHIPLFVFILWNLQSVRFQVAFDTFLMIHAGLHWVLRNHSQLKFNNWFSRLWIFGGGFLGAVHLGLLVWG
ncbi:MAG: hypothetical protein GY943_25935 [Chloroflexi bacterium]|nr:hypothetical protein [Chloroflexota bacterium]